jgi:uncharacterized membrane protein
MRSMRHPRASLNLGQRLTVLVFALFVIAVIMAICFLIGYAVGKVFL